MFTVFPINIMWDDALFVGSEVLFKGQQDQPGIVFQASMQPTHTPNASKNHHFLVGSNSVASKVEKGELLATYGTRFGRVDHD
jgi:hypothetical protein